MVKIAEDYPSLNIEVLSGGMILPEEPVHIAVTAGYINDAYHLVEERTGIRHRRVELTATVAPACVV